MIQVEIHCDTQEQVSRLIDVFPLNVGDALGLPAFHVFEDECAPYSVSIGLAKGALTRVQREILNGRCCWYEYVGESNLAALVSPNLDDLDVMSVFATWLIFQHDDVDRKWDTVFLDYAHDFLEHRKAVRWLYRDSYDLTYWMTALIAQMAAAKEQNCPLTKIKIQQMLEYIVEGMLAT